MSAVSLVFPVKSAVGAGVLGMAGMLGKVAPGTGVVGVSEGVSAGLLVAVAGMVGKVVVRDKGLGGRGGTCTWATCQPPSSSESERAFRAVASDNITSRGMKWLTFIVYYLEIFGLCQVWSAARACSMDSLFALPQAACWPLALEDRRGDVWRLVPARDQPQAWTRRPWQFWVRNLVWSKRVRPQM